MFNQKTMKLKLIIKFSLLLIPILESCDKGCTDENALNYEALVSENNSTCKYSKVGFYTSQKTVSINYNEQISWDYIELYVNKELKGVITTSHELGVGNCSVTGIVSYEFLNGNSIDWEAKFYSKNKIEPTIKSGVISPKNEEACILIDLSNIYIN